MISDSVLDAALIAYWSSDRHFTADEQDRMRLALSAAFNAAADEDEEHGDTPPRIPGNASPWNDEWHERYRDAVVALAAGPLTGSTLAERAADVADAAVAGLVLFRDRGQTVAETAMVEAVMDAAGGALGAADPQPGTCGAPGWMRSGQAGAPARSGGDPRDEPMDDGLSDDFH